jgi:CRISPR system Cascade subunit CasE
VLEVQAPHVFVRALHRGFGKAKAFGCGLMLIRRA